MNKIDKIPESKINAPLAATIIERRDGIKKHAPSAGKYLTTHEMDTLFLRSHPSVAYTNSRPPSTWRAENRMLSAAKGTFESADLIIASTGMWDLPWLQRWILQRTQTRSSSSSSSRSSEPTTQRQHLRPPAEFLSHYQSRLQTYLSKAINLHPQTKKLLFLTLHDPKSFEIYRSFGLDGLKPQRNWAAEEPKWSAFARERVWALKVAQVERVRKWAWSDVEKMKMKKEEIEGKERSQVEIWQYHEWVRGGGWRDDMHVSVEGNLVPCLAILWELARMAAEEVST